MGADRWRGRRPKKKGEESIPAEEKSNNFDMTHPKANLVPLRDVLGFLHLTGLLHMETLM